VEWTEQPLKLERPPPGNEVGLADQSKRFQEAQLAIAERIRDALYFVGVMLAVLVAILAFK
jgi:hypothetical protein